MAIKYITELGWRVRFKMVQDLARIFHSLVGRCCVAALILGNGEIPCRPNMGGDATPPYRRSRSAGAGPYRCRESSVCSEL